MNTVRPAVWKIAPVLVGIGCAMVLASQADKSDTSEGSDGPISLELRYAEAQLKLAEVNLQKVQRMNERVARAVPGDLIAEYREDVEVAKLRVQHLASGKEESRLRVWLRRAEADAKAAQARWKSGVAVNERAPGTIDPLDLERLRVQADVARLRLARGRAVADQSQEAQVQWQLNYLSDEVQRLNEEALRRLTTTRPIPYYWY